MASSAAPSQKARVAMAVSPYTLFVSPIPDNSSLVAAKHSAGNPCSHLLALKHQPQTVAFTKTASQLLDRFRDIAKSLLANAVRGHFPPAQVANPPTEKKRKKTTQLDLDIDWIHSIPVPYCATCSDPGFDRLHICLHCPFVGCFRKRHIHNHLKDNSNDHCFAVDYHQGSLYCSKCDDYIWDLDFERVLSGEKVRIDALVSKVKDSSIKRSKAVEWMPSLDDVMKIQKFSTPLPACTGIRGLSNMGSTCFMNVVLQTLIHNPLLRAYFLSDKHNQKLCRIKKSGKHCMACEMDNLFSNFYSGETAPYSPQSFLLTTWKTNSALAKYAQQDAHEFFIAVLNEIHHNCSSALPNAKDQPPCRCIIHQVFQGFLQSDVTCCHCKNVTTAKDPILDLSLNIKSNGNASIGRRKVGGGNTPTIQPPTTENSGPCTLIECLESNFAAEKLTHYQCGNIGCGRSSESEKHVTIKNLSPVLAIQLKRFEHSGQSSKIDTFVKIPTNLDMTPFTTQSIQSRLQKSAAQGKGGSTSVAHFDFLNDSVPEFRYTLFAVINHQGSLETGHYTSFVKCRGDWFLFDDHTVTLASLRDVLGSNVYMCFYVRESICFTPVNDPNFDPALLAKLG